MNPKLSADRLIDHVSRRFLHLVIANDQVSVAAIARMVGMDRRSLHRWRQNGGIPLVEAERAATTLQVHPVDIWPDYYERAEEAS